MIIKKSEKDERREKIIDVAFRLFVDKKIESVTMGEIAKEAGDKLFVHILSYYQNYNQLFIFSQYL